MNVYVIVSLLLIKAMESASTESSQWSWTCESDLCRKVNASDVQSHTSLNVCRLTCGVFGALWPQPTSDTFLHNKLMRFHPGAVRFEIANTSSEVLDFLVENTQIFIANIEAECEVPCEEKTNNSVLITIVVTSPSTLLLANVNESYVLDLKKIESTVHVRIDAETVFGARHGLETVTQLITSGSGALVIVARANIRDKPVYSHRGLLIDTARNYLPLRVILRQIDAMAASKLNVLHWHATDSQSFPLKSTTVPQLTKYGAYSAKEIYTRSDVKRLLRYAKLRGVRVVLEIDAPSHAGNGWQWGRESGLGDLALCVNRRPWRNYCIQPPCGQLNPINENVYKILEDLYGDIVGVLPKGEFFHMGGDEVFFACWNSSYEIVKYLEESGQSTTNAGFLWLWSKFQQKALDAFDRKVGNNDTKIILWSSALTEPDVITKYLDKNRYIIQTWVSSAYDLPFQLLNKGYKIIVSTKNAWYLDHGFWGSTQYYTWRDVYKNTIPKHSNVLGGEVCMWGELVDEHVIDSRIWPRAAAAAERLWADPIINTALVENRFFRHRERLVTRGIRAEALAPQWCVQNEGDC